MIAWSPFADGACGNDANGRILHFRRRIIYTFHNKEAFFSSFFFLFFVITPALRFPSFLFFFCIFHSHLLYKINLLFFLASLLAVSRMEYLYGKLGWLFLFTCHNFFGFLFLSSSVSCIHRLGHMNHTGKEMNIGLKGKVDRGS